MGVETGRIADGDDVVSPTEAETDPMVVEDETPPPPIKGKNARKRERLAQWVRSLTGDKLATHEKYGYGRTGAGSEERGGSPSTGST